MNYHGFKEYYILELTSIPGWVPESMYKNWVKMVGRFSVFSAQRVLGSEFQDKYNHCFKIRAKFYIPQYHRVSAMNTNYWGAYHTLDGVLEYVIKRHWLCEVMGDD